MLTAMGAANTIMFIYQKYKKFSLLHTDYTSPYLQVQQTSLPLKIFGVFSAMA